VAGVDAESNLAAARAARETLPDAVLVAYAGDEPGREVVASLRTVADRVIHPGAEILAHLQAVVESDDGARSRSLRAALEAIDGRLGVFTHDNPDPDAIASAMALVELAGSVGVDAEACYYGEISHQENRAFVNLLDLHLRQFEPDEDASEFDAVALVDHSRPGVNDQLPEDTQVDIVVDHHPPKLPVEAGFVDLREEAGATSTLLAEHLERLGVEVSEEVATALLYGIRVDTDDFTREVSSADFEAAAYLLPRADVGVLERVESPSMSRETLETIAQAIRNRRLDDGVLATCVGATADRDALAQAADRLLAMEGVTTTLVYGFSDGTIFVSARARGADIDLGETVREAFGRIGSAGGHTDMAGAQIPLGILGEVERDEEAPLSRVVEDIVTGRFFDTVRTVRRRSGSDEPGEPGFEFPVAAETDGDGD
jgi:nanoRNase/pAp phosphatase (c-di-AMP/oligoRNAs hydrolase)